MGITGLFTRFWTYHGWYDDLLVLPAMIALYRIAKQGESSLGFDVMAGTLLGVTLCIMVAPGGQYLLSSPWNMVFMNVQMILWAIDMIFLHKMASKCLSVNYSLSP